MVLLAVAICIFGNQSASGTASDRPTVSMEIPRGCLITEAHLASLAESIGLSFRSPISSLYDEFFFTEAKFNRFNALLTKLAPHDRFTYYVDNVSAAGAFIFNDSDLQFNERTYDFEMPNSVLEGINAGKPSPGILPKEVASQIGAWMKELGLQVRGVRFSPVPYLDHGAWRLGYYLEVKFVAKDSGYVKTMRVEVVSGAAR